MRTLRRILVALLVLLALLWAGLAVYAYWPATASGASARELAGPADRFVTVEGIELRYRSFGEPAAGRPDVVLLHGFANSLQTFRLLAPRLAGRFHVITVDAPGFGLSAKPAGHDYGNAAQARVIARFAAALGLERYVIGGHSMGGTLAACIAASDPHVAGLVLMNPGIITTGVPAITQYFVWPLPRVMARVFGTRELRESFLRRSYLDPRLVTDAVMDDIQLASRSADYLDGMTSLMGQYRTGEEPAAARRVRVPTLVIWGLQDRSKQPGEAAAVRDLIPGAVLIEVPEAGHYVHEEQPAAVAAAIMAGADRWR
ncbi:MAG: alpha/beta hydrolase [Gammaproteobacteria bacterium]|nr:alpha/beta hydrolase [Gammaproteobacteria bacterium]